MHGTRSANAEQQAHASRSPTGNAQMSVPGFIRSLSQHARSVALVAGGVEVTYGELIERLDDAIEKIGTDRHLVHVRGVNQIDMVVAHLASLRAGHAVLLTPPTDAGAEIADRVLDPSSEPLHPELALVMM